MFLLVIALLLIAGIVLGSGFLLTVGVGLLLIPVLLFVLFVVVVVVTAGNR